MSWRHIVFTAWDKPEFDAEKLVFIQWEEEECPTTNKKHWQGYAHGRKPARRGQWIKWLGVKKHPFVDQQRGTNAENDLYTSKTGQNFFRWGVPSESGVVTTTIAMRDAILSGKKRAADFVHQVTSATQLQFLRQLEMFAPIQENPDLKVTWIYGVPRTGKTTLAKDIVGKPFWISEDVGGSNPWNMYYGQPGVILDDLRPNDVKLHVLLRWLDVHGVHVNVKYSSQVMCPKNICITSIMSPQVFLERTKTDWIEPDEQLLGRIHNVIKATGPGCYETIKGNIDLYGTLGNTDPTHSQPGSPEIWLE